jgi:hypothetical protein
MAEAAKAATLRTTTQRILRAIGAVRTYDDNEDPQRCIDHVYQWL